MQGPKVFLKPPTYPIFFSSGQQCQQSCCWIQDKYTRTDNIFDTSNRKQTKETKNSHYSKKEYLIHLATEVKRLCHSKLQSIIERKEWRVKDTQRQPVLVEALILPGH